MYYALLIVVRQSRHQPGSRVQGFHCTNCCVGFLQPVLVGLVWLLLFLFGNWRRYKWLGMCCSYFKETWVERFSGRNFAVYRVEGIFWQTCWWFLWPDMISIVVRCASLSVVASRQIRDLETKTSVKRFVKSTFARRTCQRPWHNEYQEMRSPYKKEIRVS